MPSHHRVAALGWATLLSAITSAIGAATPLATQQSALQAFYDATDGPNWVQAEGWSADSPIGCDAVGLTCDDAGNVQEIFLVDNGLNGALPAELAEITSLRGLVLNRNQLRGPIPGVWSTLPNLQLLSLRDNLVDGTLDDNLADISSLKVLDLCHNALQGALPAAYLDMPNLGALAVCNNAFSTALPEVGNAQSLYDLDLGGNQFSGALDPAYFEMPSLWRLDLSGNALTGQLPTDLSAPAPLVTLDMADNRLSGRINTQLTQFPDLSAITLDRNRLRGALPDNFDALPALRRFSASGNRITDGIPTSLETHSALADNAASGNPAVTLDWNPLTLDERALGWLQSVGTDTGTVIQPVEGVSVRDDGDTVTLAWSPASLPSGTVGHYRIETAEGEALAETESLDTSRIELPTPDGVDPDTLNIVTVVPAHEANPNAIENGASVSDTTDPVSWTPESVFHPVNHGEYTAHNWAPSQGDLTTVITDVSDTALFATGPTITDEGALVFTPNDRVGVADITVEITQGQVSESRRFAIDIGVAANRAPSFTPGEPVETDTLGRLQVIEWASSLDDGDNGTQSLQFTFDNPDSDFFAYQPELSVPSGTLRFRVNPGQTGSVAIGVQLKDNGGTENGGQDTSERFILTITATDQSAVDSASLGQDAATASGGGTISAWVILFLLCRNRVLMGSVMRRRLVSRLTSATLPLRRGFQPL